MSAPQCRYWLPASHVAIHQMRLMNLGIELKY
jgi:hypothetical protein